VKNKKMLQKMQILRPALNIAIFWMVCTITSVI